MLGFCLGGNRRVLEADRPEKPIVEVCVITREAVFRQGEDSPLVLRPPPPPAPRTVLPSCLFRVLDGFAAITKECAPWAVECSLHPWLQGARPLLGAMLTVSPDNMSLLWRHQRYDSSGGDRGNGLHSEQKPSEGHSERFSDRFAEPRWTRASSLEGMWDVVESTLEGNGALEALFTSSGACVVRGGRKVAEGGRGVLRANL